MSRKYVLMKLNELDEAIASMTDEDLEALVKGKNLSNETEYDYLCEAVLGMRPGAEPHIHSPEFLRTT